MIDYSLSFNAPIRNPLHPQDLIDGRWYKLVGISIVFLQVSGNTSKLQVSYKLVGISIIFLYFFKSRNPVVLTPADL